MTSSAVTATTEVFHSAPVMLRLGSDSTRLVIEVHDLVTTWPWPHHTQPGQNETGRGLMLVAHYSDLWGCYPHGNGKIVWALLQAGAAR